VEHDFHAGPDPGEGHGTGGRLKSDRLDRFAEVLAGLGSVLLLAATLVWVVDIVGRQTVGYSVIGLNDLTQLLVMSFISLALPITFLREQNVMVDLFVDALPRALRKGLTAIMALASAVFVGALAWYAWQQGLREFAEKATSSTLAIPMIWYWVPVLAGSTIATLLALVVVVRHCRPSGSRGA
jgi:TRAP-type C4-dicarboxylate transport system permease small subunit